MAEPYDWYRKQARELMDRESNMVTSYYGTLYTCELQLNSIWEKDMGGLAFEKDRWTDIFNTATQFAPDLVPLTPFMPYSIRAISKSLTEKHLVKMRHKNA